ncbi:unnamed protein product [Peronospora farinosa]|uniref:Uncharacterized protein n=1 Tax=Peronospora farinosa TaxID=134698 RepID=A0ABN8C9D7_9STRA|nr:unnamed protein product [Peronospora farinosa]
MHHTEAFSSSDTVTSKDFALATTTMGLATSATLSDRLAANEVAAFATTMANTEPTVEDVLEDSKSCSDSGRRVLGLRVEKEVDLALLKRIEVDDVMLGLVGEPIAVFVGLGAGD